MALKFNKKLSKFTPNLQKKLQNVKFGKSGRESPPKRT